MRIIREELPAQDLLGWSEIEEILMAPRLDRSYLIGCCSAKAQGS